MNFIKEDNKIIIFLANKHIEFDDDKIKLLLLGTLNILIEEYDIELKDFYTINLYNNDFYGIIIELIEEENYYNNDSINMELKVVQDKLFLYEVNDPLEYLDNDIYYYNNRYYISLKKYDIAIFENSNIIYNDDVYKVLGEGVKI